MAIPKLARTLRFSGDDTGSCGIGCSASTDEFAGWRSLSPDLAAAGESTGGGGRFALLGLIVFYRVSQRFFPVQISVCRPWPLIALLALSFWWLNGILLRALAWYGEVPWSAETLWHSRLIQTCFALFWMLAALVVMLRATRRCSRREWLCGSVLLGIVIVKLMLVDSARGGGLARAVTFIGVAILVLIVGYFSPLPPKAGEEK